MEYRKLSIVLMGLPLVLAACGGSTQATEALPTAIVEEPADATPEIELGQPSATYAIDPNQSEARFIIDEVLAGEDNTVVGRTSAVEGLLILDPANPADVEVGTIRVDLGTLRTDSQRRDGAIRNFILQTDQAENQFALFAIRGIEGLPGAAEPDRPYSLTLSGDLTVHGVTMPVTFDGEASLISNGQVSGSFSTTVFYKDFNLSIPSVPLVASVDEDVRLELEFVAVES